MDRFVKQRVVFRVTEYRADAVRDIVSGFLLGEFTQEQLLDKLDRLMIEESQRLTAIDKDRIEAEREQITGVPV